MGSIFLDLTWSVEFVSSCLFGYLGLSITKLAR